MLANSELCSVNGKWERTCQTRVAAPRREAKSPRATDQHAILLLDPSCPGLAPLLQRTQGQDDSFGGPIPYHYCRIYEGPEERQRSARGAMGFLARSDSQEPRLPSPAVLPITPRPRTWDERAWFFLSFLHVFFDSRILSCRQLRSVLCGCSELVQRATTSRPPSPMIP